MTDAQILAGVRLGADRVLGGGDDSFQGAASIAAITTKGALARTSIIAGVDPVNGIYGDLDDALASGGSGSIGAISLGANGAPSLGTANFVHQFAIQAAKFKSLKTTAGLIKTFTADPLYLDNAVAGEDAGDIVVRLR
jgi:hypothetical protein